MSPPTELIVSLRRSATIELSPVFKGRDTAAQGNLVALATIELKVHQLFPALKDRANLKPPLRVESIYRTERVVNQERQKDE